MSAVIGRDPAGNVYPVATGTEALDAYIAPIRRLLEHDITEVCINRPFEGWTEGSEGWVRHDMPDLSYFRLRQLATLTAHSVIQSVKDESPIASVALATGERVQVITPPACEAGTVSFTIRKPSNVRFGMADYESAGFFEDVVTKHGGLQPFEVQLLELMEARKFREFFTLAVQKKQTMLISGATGSGKTTFMKALVDLVPPEERIITIEDTPELSLSNQPNHVRLFYTKGKDAKWSAGTLIEASMRMKPDRLFPAELRDDAAYYFLMATNTGHPGSISSIHSNDEVEALPRMADLAAAAAEAKTTTHAALLRRIEHTIDIVAHVGKVGGKRRITGIFYDPERKRATVG